MRGLDATFTELGQNVDAEARCLPFRTPVAADVFRDEEIEQLRAEKARLETELREARDTIKGKDETAAKERAAMIQRFID